MQSRTIDIPRFFYIEKDLLVRINEVLTNENIELEKHIIVSGQTFTRSLGDSVAASLDGESLRVCIDTSGQLSLENVEQAIRTFEPSLVVAVGGGKILDVAKFCAYKMRKPFLAIPTVLSHDGLASPVAVIRTGETVKSVGAIPPVGILVDTEIIRKSPKHTILSGVGDLISDISAIDDWELANKYVGEKIDMFAKILAESAVNRFIQLCVKNWNETLSIEEDEFVISLAKGLIQSGIAMAVAGSSRPCSGAEHLISHALDKLLDFARPHGLQVGLATIFTMALRKKEPLEIIEIYKRIGFPTKPKELGISLATFMEAVKIGPLTRDDRFTILNLVSEQDIQEAINATYGHDG